MAARLDGPKADGVNLAVNFVFTDVEGVVPPLDRERGAAPPARREARSQGRRHRAHDQGHAREDGARPGRPARLIFGKELDVDGSRTDLLKFFSLLDAPDPNFAIVDLP
jgi:alkyl sulfatase BDS1-like metallo-beta-lactamase superfamily hydrolase